MAGWLSRATSLFQQPPTPPEPFEVECDCGRKVTGIRMGVYQKPTCPACERSVFVLPINVYPRPKLKSNSPIKSGRRNDDAKSTRASSQVVEDREAATSTKSSSIPKSLTGQVSHSQIIAEPLISREQTPPLITPLRIITFGIVLMTLLTIGGLWHRHRLQSAKAIVSLAADAGKAAFDEHDFVKAAAEYERARQAVDILGRTDQTAIEIRRSSREIMALAKLASSTLTECLQETVANNKLGQTEPPRMSSVIKGAWVIFDSNIYQAAEGNDRYVIDAPILLNEGIVRIEIETSIFRTIVNHGELEEAPRIIFAAQLDQLSSLKGDPLTAVLSLNGKTAFLWMNYETYTAIGYRPFDTESEQQTRAVLERQIEPQQK